jgi:hypothetical protein
MDILSPEIAAYLDALSRLGHRLYRVTATPISFGSLSL